MVAGAGGFSETQPRTHVSKGASEGQYTLAVDPIVHFGFLTVTVDMKTKRLTIAYRPSDAEIDGDSVTVDLEAGRLA